MIWRSYFGRAGRSQTAGSRGTDDSGFTLPELLIALVIGPMVIAAIAGATILVLSLQSSTNKSFSDSADAQVVSNYFENDIQTAADLTTSSTVSGQCGSTGTQLLGLEWAPNSAGTFQDVVSYMEVAGTGSTYQLRRYDCTAGAATTPTLSTLISSDIPALVSGADPFTVASTTTYTTPPWSQNWTTMQGITNVTFAVTEPGSNYNYSLVADPTVGAQAASASGGSGVGTSTSCGFATPGPNYVLSNLCFVSFAAWNTQTKATGVTCPTTPPVSGASTPFPMAAGITNTPYTMEMCLSVLSTSSSGRTITGTPLGGGLDDIVAVPFPTYASPPGSEAFLGDNGFYTGVAGDPALYQCAGDQPNCYQSPAEGSVSTLYFTNVQVLNGNGQAASGWELVTGDAESTDAGESITWTTCPGITANASFPNAGSSCGTTSVDPDLNILSNGVIPGEPYGNACATTTGTDLATPGTQSVECAATVSSDKTGTVMLSAVGPSAAAAPNGMDLTIRLVGTGLEGIFVGVLLP